MMLRWLPSARCVATQLDVEHNPMAPAGLAYASDQTLNANRTPTYHRHRQKPSRRARSLVVRRKIVENISLRLVTKVEVPAESKRKPQAQGDGNRPVRHQRPPSYAALGHAPVHHERRVLTHERKRYRSEPGKYGWSDKGVYGRPIDVVVFAVLPTSERPG